MLTEYLNYLKAIRGYSENTIKAYAADLAAFARWAKENKADARWSTITRDDIDKYITTKYEEGLSASTTNRTLAAISSLYMYFQREGLIIVNPCKYESRRKLPETIPAVLRPTELKKAYQQAFGVRKMMLGILATTGIRIQELLDLQWEDIDFDENTIRITGKGSKQRMVRTTAEVLAELRKVWTMTHPTGRILYISQRTARYMIYETLRPYCSTTHLNPHTIRHTFATQMAKDGENIATIAKILGHNHIETSQKYINLAEIPTPRMGIRLT